MHFREIVFIHSHFVWKAWEVFIKMGVWYFAESLRDQCWPVSGFMWRSDRTLLLFYKKQNYILQNYCLISAVVPYLIKNSNFICNIFYVLYIWRSTEIIFLMNNHIYAVCYIYNIKLLLSCGKIPKPVNMMSDQEFMLKVSTFHFA
jgi:hypothetical protein